LRSENHYDLPKSATSLLQTKSIENIQVMKSLKNTNGSYVYFSIEKRLKGIISYEYTENAVRYMFNIDGLPSYNSSSQQFWPNLGLIVHDKYDSNPFIAAVYSGDSKYKNVNDFINPVNSVFLDSMYLSNLGIMKWILQQLLDAKMRVNRKCKLSQNKIKHFNSTLKKFI